MNTTVEQAKNNFETYAYECTSLNKREMRPKIYALIYVLLQTD